MITVSLETAKKLKEAGWSRSSSFVYEEHESLTQHIYYKGSVSELDDNMYQAPTAQEILDELQQKTEIDGYRHKVVMYGYLDGGCGVEIAEGIEFRGRSLVEALTAARIRCKENGYLSTINNA